MKKNLTRQQFLSVSVMLFGMFFGAGNLIFPPLLGKEAGNLTFQSLLFFCVTAVVFPVLGVLVVARTHGLPNLAGRVGKVFAAVFTACIYLSIGPGLGIPRAGSLPFEMAVAPYLPQGSYLLTSRFFYTAMFFFIAYLVCLRPSKLVDRMGKILTPGLLILILIMFLGLFFNNPNNIAAPSEAYLKAPVVKGFLEGYNTMDTIAALNFGLVISLAVRSFKIDDENTIVSYTIKSGVVAGILLTVVYSMLAYIGMTTSGVFGSAKNGAEILSLTSQRIFGPFGIVFLAAIFTLACLTTCIGLITSVSQYFANVTKNKVTYNQWIVVWTLLSFFVANFGLNTILKISVPVLVAIYPVSIVLILLGLTQNIFKYNRFGYRLMCYVTVFVSVIEGLQAAKLNIPFVTELVSKLPLYSLSLGWVLPLLVCWLVSLAHRYFLKVEDDFTVTQLQYKSL